MRWHPLSYSELQPMTLCMYDNMMPVWRPLDHVSEDDPYGTLARGPLFTKFDLVNFTEIKNQLDTTFTFDINTSEFSVVWTEASTPHAGTMIRAKPHMHALAFHKGFIFRASARDMGFIDGKYEFPMYNAYAFTLLRDTGLQTADDLEAYWFHNLETSARDHDERCKPSIFSNWSLPGSCAFSRPFLICEMHGNTEDVYEEVLMRTFAYDRRASACCNPWTFKSNEVWTTASIFKPIRSDIGPWMLDIPKAFGEHHQWTFFFSIDKSTDWSDPRLVYKKDWRDISYINGGMYYPPSTYFGGTGGDISDYFLRIPPTTPYDVFYRQIVIPMVYACQWADALYKSPLDLTTMMEDGAYSRYTHDVDDYMSTVGSAERVENIKNWVSHLTFHVFVAILLCVFVVGCTWACVFSAVPSQRAAMLVLPRVLSKTGVFEGATLRIGLLE